MRARCCTQRARIKSSAANDVTSMSGQIRLKCRLAAGSSVVRNTWLQISARYYLWESVRRWTAVRAAVRTLRAILRWIESSIQSIVTSSLKHLTHSPPPTSSLGHRQRNVRFSWRKRKLKRDQCHSWSDGSAQLLPDGEGDGLILAY